MGKKNAERPRVLGRVGVIIVGGGGEKARVPDAWRDALRLAIQTPKGGLSAWSLRGLSHTVNIVVGKRIGDSTLK